MADVTIYSSDYCPFCVRAKQLLDMKNVSFNEINVDGNRTLRQEMMEKSGRHTVPQIWIDNHHVGGCDELFALEREQKLDPMLSV
ncbi:glutaredoxin 3 [Marinomonas mediterranea]|jgi:Glutaredoxin, GrxC family|uniref:Glutaredoxin n=1 Tax=Marinomonas mediterranea (strain ATCC 700492 / JCM 21426 / NBRC 103028 / MMB-1) TaxID=717774 RepID=F2JUE2_MARM1|nr:glutaredoxin 3 [Marinomonas mediterranea]ADZ92761.1 glutaredoxin 3 [Marinomonas mediterranea MMB-1]WCN10690.1 glutaredoxin 3 [Marinomonas mediterranea]WCN14747.1 glutaredoxin 3 [Marinomonas mediterranea]WCN18788.1 glutaredoxin 3 [Marinomonas mediterranea MMB-1]